ncbi:MAG: chemotaxis protein CheW [Nakamurella sp.]
MTASVTMVCFTAAGGSYCLPVDATRAVRRAAGLIALPGAGPDVVGVLPGDPPLTVLSSLGVGGDHVLVVESGPTVFGLQVDAVTGLRRVTGAEIRPAPPGQDRPLISGTVDSTGELLFVTDAIALAARL